MAWAPCRWTTAFRRCAGLGAARLTSPTTQHLRPSRPPTAWPSATSTSWALVSTWRRTTTPPPACNARPRGAVVAAAVEVVVVDTTRELDVVDDCDGGSDPILHVYGSVATKTRPASGNRWVEERSLFHRAKGEPAHVARGAAVPLLQTTALVCAPLCSDSELQVSAELSDASASWQNPDQEIARGSVVFAPLLAGTDTAEIAGADGKVRVDVTWST